MSKTSYSVVLHRQVLGEIKKLPKPVRAKVKTAISTLADEPIPPQAIRLSGRANAYRLRFADYRLVYEVHATEIVVYVIGIAHRREVYQRILRRQQSP